MQKNAILLEKKLEKWIFNLNKNNVKNEILQNRINEMV